MKLRWRELSVGIAIAAIVSLALQCLEPVLSILSPLLVLPMILALGFLSTITKFPLTGKTVAVALVAGLLFNLVPYPAGSFGTRVSFYAQLAYYKNELDAQCAPAISCRETMTTEGFGSIVQGLARDDSGVLLSAGVRNWPPPVPLTGCERIVHLYGPYFHFTCG